MSARERWLDALISKVATALAPEPTTDLYGTPIPSRDRLHIDICSAGEVSAAEWEAMAVAAELRNVALLRSKYARDAFATVEGTLGAAALRNGPFGLVITISYGPWEPPPTGWPWERAVEPPPVPRSPVPRRSEPEPAAPVPGSGPEHVWPRWY